MNSLVPGRDGKFVFGKLMIRFTETGQRKSLGWRCDTRFSSHPLEMTSDVCHSCQARRYALIFRYIEWKVLPDTAYPPVMSCRRRRTWSSDKSFSIRRRVFLWLPGRAGQLPTLCLTLKPQFLFDREASTGRHVFAFPGNEIPRAG